MSDHIFLINSLRKGGAERQAAFFLKSFPHFKAITLEPGCEYDIPSDQIYYSPHQQKNKFFQIISTIYRLIKIKPKTVVSFLEFSNYANILVSFITGHKAIISVRTSLAFHKGLKGKINLFLIKMIYPYASLITSNSSDSIKLLKNYLNLPDEHFAVIPNAIADHIYRQDEYTPPQPNETLKIIVVGRLEPVKNFQAAIKILSQLKKEIPCQLTIVGDGLEKEKLLKLCEELNLSISFSEGGNADCIFLGKVNNPELYLRKSHLFLLTSLTEGLPNTLLESMANKLPCIASDCPTGPREILQNKQEFLFPVPANFNTQKLYVNKIREMILQGDFHAASDEMSQLSLKYSEIEIKVKWQHLFS